MTIIHAYPQLREGIATLQEKIAALYLEISNLRTSAKIAAVVFRETEQERDALRTRVAQLEAALWALDTKGDSRVE